jgi:hypothetical protein
VSDGAAMDKPDAPPAPDGPAETPAARAAREAREARLAAALRENLRRRKAQARARATSAPGAAEKPGAE